MCLQYVLTRLDLLRTPKAAAEAQVEETDEREVVGAAR